MDNTHQSMFITTTLILSSMKSQNREEVKKQPQGDNIYKRVNSPRANRHFETGILKQ